MHDTFNTLSGFFATVRGTLFSKYPDRAALAMLDKPSKPSHVANLVQLKTGQEVEKEVRA